MLKSASVNGKAKARTLSHSLWNLKTTRSALFEQSRIDNYALHVLE